MDKQNRLVKKLAIKYPIVQAGMAGGVTSPSLVAEVSTHGGLGTLGGGYMLPEEMRSVIRDIKGRTNASFAVNLFVPEYPEASGEEITAAHEVLAPYYDKLAIHERQDPSLDVELFEQQIHVVLEEKVPVVSFTFGLPSGRVMKALKQSGVVTIGTATTVEEAVLNEMKGLDIVVAQGSEAGGHRGSFLQSYDKSMIGLFSLIPQVVDAVKIPVIGAGGIMDGRGFSAALSLGAEGVQMGTAFVTSRESGAHDLHKQMIQTAREDEMTLTNAFSGKPARGIRNNFTRSLSNHKDILPYPLQNQMTKTIRQASAADRNPEYMSLWAGQSPRLSRDGSAEDVIKSLVSYVEEHRILPITW
ncbi:nitronate monooxygenase [Halobacillus halophilus]|uniref:NAD(P)H-dependent flavin oxidoreductase n=1 Tax=Halobacillus halophilus TaxID=1570 RepID=UPI001369BE57|nr:nitronate monooxygenase [Halobacillus halophilus]MYL28749.1 nitronate monooxygenase [Halobacillus halophilus]